MWLQDAKACLLNHSSPWYLLPPCFSSTPAGSPPQWREWSLCMLWGACYCAACFTAPGIPVHRTASMCSARCASWVSLKKVLTQVFSYKQKTTVWSSIIYTGWQWFTEIDFPPSYKVYCSFLPFFCFPVCCICTIYCMIKHLLDGSLYLGEYPHSFSPLSFLMMALLCFLTGAMNPVCVNRSLLRSACSQNSEGEQIMGCLVDVELL